MDKKYVFNWIVAFVLLLTGLLIFTNNIGLLVSPHKEIMWASAGFVTMVIAFSYLVYLAQHINK